VDCGNEKNLPAPLAIELSVPWSSNMQSSNFTDPENDPAENLISHQKI
jgi:hypothetical protein